MPNIAPPALAASAHIQTRAPHSHDWWNIPPSLIKSFRRSGYDVRDLRPSQYDDRDTANAGEDDEQ